MINGVIHSAGVEGEGLLVRKKEKKFANVLNPKVAGTWVLDHLTRDDHPVFSCIVFISGNLFNEPGPDRLYSSKCIPGFLCRIQEQAGEKNTGPLTG